MNVNGALPAMQGKQIKMHVKFMGWIPTPTHHHYFLQYTLHKQPTTYNIQQKTYKHEERNDLTLARKLTMWQKYRKTAGMTKLQKRDIEPRVTITLLSASSSCLHADYLYIVYRSLLQRPGPSPTRLSF